MHFIIPTTKSVVQIPSTLVAFDSNHQKMSSNHQLWTFCLLCILITAPASRHSELADDKFAKQSSIFVIRMWESWTKYVVSIYRLWSSATILETVWRATVTLHCTDRLTLHSMKEYQASSSCISDALLITQHHGSRE
ncbi:unnamed protein product [Lactuca saligna]|uniref:Uncharacterized protein n=1 Tax=Lactuca saligna TaxID=75948 RepID=A0AA35VCN9_LACSI|nr:unnamed protein product [Lactuca saligna]